MNVLIVEDGEKRSADLARLVIFHQVQVVENSEAATSALNRSDFGLVFLDYDLEGDDTSVEVAHHIAARTDPPPVIIHSANPAGVARLTNILSDAVAVPIEEIRQGSRRVGLLRTILTDPACDKETVREWMTGD